MLQRSRLYPLSVRNYVGPSVRKFHRSQVLYNSNLPDHYATLGVSSGASANEIKKSFYKLSKQYHPDINSDPSASTRFVAISEAYHVLGSPDQRSRYDRDHQRVYGTSTTAQRGSYSSASTPAGGRPASGLSRRRSTFRGPPPSFYNSGGWGKQDSKRARYAYYGQSEPPPPHPENHESASDARGSPGGFGPGQEWESAWQDPNIPYWDRAGHKRTQEGLEGKAKSTAARQASREADAYRELGERGIWIQFSLVSTVVLLGILTPLVMWK